MNILFSLLMNIYLNIILLPFILVRALFFGLTLFTAKNLSYLAYIPYVFLFLWDIFMVVISFGFINDIAYDLTAMNNTIKLRHFEY